MTKLYNKNKLLFALLWIIIYITGTIVFNNIADLLNLTNFFTLLFYLFISIILLFWIFKNKLNSEFGLIKSPFNAKYFLYFIPLAILVSTNFWFGFKLEYDFTETLIFVISMLCVGFLEEIIFRGFLFNAMRKDNLKCAIIVGSLTFGFGHIINLFTGNADILSTILQICYATTTGFLFIIIFLKGKTLLPCIITHSLFNSLSVFSVSVSKTINITTAVVIIILTLSYSLFLIKALPKQEQIINKE